MKNKAVFIRRSPISQKVHSMTFNMSQDEFDVRFEKWNKGALIQEAFSNLTANEREFIMTGITPEEFDKTFATQ